MDKKENNMFNVKVEGKKNKINLKGNAPDVSVETTGKKNVIKTKK